MDCQKENLILRQVTRFLTLETVLTAPLRLPKQTTPLQIKAF